MLPAGSWGIEECQELTLRAIEKALLHAYCVRRAEEGLPLTS